MSQPYFVDANIWLYRLLDNQSLDPQEGKRKRRIATTLTQTDNVIVSTQVVNEVCANVLRKAAFTEEQIKALVQSFDDRCVVIILNSAILIHASDLRTQYGFSFWDGLIVASAIAANAETLYSEDMQDELIVAKRLKIINPFK